MRNVPIDKVSFSLIFSSHMEKLVITAAITGAGTTKDMNPNVPITPEEQAREAKTCVDAGASIIHLHVRDKNGKPSAKLEDFSAAISEIKRYLRNDVVLQLSTQGAPCSSIEERIAPIIHFRPEMASLTIASMNFGEEAFINPPREVESLAKFMAEAGVKPVIECYDAGHIETVRRLVKKGLIKEPVCFQFILGVPGGLSGEVYNINHLVNMLSPGDIWTVAGIGRYHLSAAVMAIIMGGHVRVGFEDNVYYQEGQLATSNAQMVQRIKRLAQELGREVASPDDARRIFSLCRG